MAAPRKDSHPWTLKVLEVLEDREWHPYTDVMLEACVLVPPGMGWRLAEAARAAHYKSKGKVMNERVHGGREDTILTGQKSAVASAILGLRRNNRVEVEYVDPASVRKRPSRVRRID